LDELQRFLRYRFNDVGLLETALTHRSKSATNNERLEFLGDAVLGLVVAEALYFQFGRAPEGQLSRYRAALVKKDTLAELARGFSLGDFLRLGTGELKSGGCRRDSILADGMEAVFGALYLDGGLEAVRCLILRSLEARLASLSPDTDLKDPKTRLQEYLQARQLPLPDYSTVSIAGDGHDQCFEVQCVVATLDKLVVGAGNNRRRAEQAAAAQALEYLTRNLPYDSS
jgi:ribonuclease-3